MERAECNRNNWTLAAIAGVLVLLFASGLGDTHWLGGLFLGGLTCWMLGGTLVWLNCAEVPVLPPAKGAAPTAGRQPDTPPASAPVRDPAAARMPIVAGAMPANAAGSGLSVPRAEPATTEKAKAPAPSEVKAAPAGTNDTAPPDDLKRIKGIGPKLSDWLHEHGVTRYAQIAEWDAATIADYAHRLGRMGNRIETDDWVGQARLLAAGGETAFSHRVDDGEVY